LLEESRRLQYDAVRPHMADHQMTATSSLGMAYNLDAQFVTQGDSKTGSKVAIPMGRDLWRYVFIVS
jgi:hypothetical protein